MIGAGIVSIGGGLTGPTTVFCVFEQADNKRANQNRIKNDFIETGVFEA